MHGDPNTALQRAFDRSKTRRIARELYGLSEAVVNPEIGVEAAKKHFEEHGVVGGAARIAASSITAPYEAWSQNLSKGQLGEYPLETLVSGLGPLAYLIPGGAGLAGGAARMARMGGVAKRLGKFATNPAVRTPARIAEVADVAVGLREWPLEVGANVVMDVGTTGLGRIAQGEPLIPIPKAFRRKTATAPGSPTQAGPTDPYFEIQPTDEQIRAFYTQAGEGQDFNVPPPVIEPHGQQPPPPFNPANISPDVPFVPPLGVIVPPDGSFPDPEQQRLDASLAPYSPSPAQFRPNQFLHPEAQAWLAQRQGTTVTSPPAPEPTVITPSQDPPHGQQPPPPFNPANTNPSVPFVPGLGGVLMPPESPPSQSLPPQPEPVPTPETPQTPPASEPAPEPTGLVIDQQFVDDTNVRIRREQFDRFMNIDLPTAELIENFFDRVVYIATTRKKRTGEKLSRDIESARFLLEENRFTKKQVNAHGRRVRDAMKRSRYVTDVPDRPSGADTFTQQYVPQEATPNETGSIPENQPVPSESPASEVETDDQGVVLDRSGNRLKLYHGSGSIEQIKQSGFETDKSVAPGIYFTDDLSIAAGYVQGGGFASANVIMKNPFVHVVPPNVTGAIHVSPIVEKAKQDGHDGVIIKNYNDNAAVSNVTAGDSRANVYIVFDPNQIVDAKVGLTDQSIPQEATPNETAPIPENQPVAPESPSIEAAAQPPVPAPEASVGTETGGTVEQQVEPEQSVAGDDAQVAAATPEAEVDGPYEPVSPPEAQRTILSNVTEDGYQAEYMVADLFDLIPSLLPTRQENPAFPSWLQPRNRTRAALWQLATSRSRNVEPQWYLADVPYLQDGTPIIGPDAIVESGNGRILALMLASIQSPQQWGKYLNQLTRDIGQYGLTAADLEGKNNPVLVRRRLSQVNRRDFVREANDPNQAGFSSVEQSQMSAENLSDALMSQFNLTSGVDLRAMLLTDVNKPFLVGFLQKFPPEERAKLVDAKGMINADGIARLEQGMLARTYSGEAGQIMVSQFIEQTSDTMKRLETALRESLPQIAAAEHLIKIGVRPAELTIAEDIAKAVTLLNELHRARTPVSDFLAQGNPMADDLSDTVRKLIPFLDQHKRGTKRFRSFLKSYAGMVMNAEEANTTTGDLFGEDALTAETVDKDELVDAAMEENVELQGFLLDVAGQRYNARGDTRLRGNHSALKDANGEPITLYHGSPMGVDVEAAGFSGDLLGQNTFADSAKEGFFFTDSEMVAESYMLGRDPRPLREWLDKVRYQHDNIRVDEKYGQFFIYMVPPEGAAEVAGMGHGTREAAESAVPALRESLKKMIDEEQATLDRIDTARPKIIEAHLSMTNPLIVDASDFSAGKAIHHSTLEAKRGGHDGLVITNVRDTGPGVSRMTNVPEGLTGAHFVVFNANQIINAKTGNRMAPAPDGQLTDIAGDRQDSIRRANPTLNKKIDRIIKEEPIKGVRRVIRGIYQNILSGKPVNLVGKQIRSATELAVLGQAFRDALIESTRIVYLDENLQIIRQEGWSLNRSNRTTAGDHQSIDEHMNRIGAKYFMRLHNHPSATAILSPGDVNAVEGWRKYFGEQFMGDVVINSGTYAYAVWNKSGEFSQENDVSLPAEMVGWDTTTEPGAGDIIPGDPLYEGASPPIAGLESTEAVVRLGNLLKAPKNWVTLAMVGLNGRIGAILEYQGIENLNSGQVYQWIRKESEMWSGLTVHVLASEGDWYKNWKEAKEKFFTLVISDEHADFLQKDKSEEHYSEGIGSVWIDGKPMHPPRQGETSTNSGYLRPAQPATLTALEAYEVGNENAPNPIPYFIDEAYKKTGLTMELNDYVRQPGVAGTYVGTGKAGTASSTLNKVRTQVGKVDERISTNLGILDHLDGWTAKARQTGRWLASEVRSGYRVAEKLQDAGKELMGVVQERRDFVRRNQARDQQRQKDVMDRRKAYVEAQHKAHRDSGGRENMDVFYVDFDDLLWRYIEDPAGSVQVPPDLQELMDDFKSVRRLINKERATFMMQLRDDVEANSETLSIWDSENNTERWHPIMPGWMWDEESQHMIRVEPNPSGGQMMKYYTVEEAIDISDRLYMPHDYTRGHWDNVYSQSNAFVNLLSQPNPNLPENLFTYDNAADTWTNTRGEVFDNPHAAAKAEITYQLSRRDKATYYLRQMEAMAEGRLGRHGHLERKRETEDDDNYQRDLGLLMNLDDAFWERSGDIRYYGQFDPVFQSHPRLKVYLERIRSYAANPKEEALRAFTAPLIFENIVSGNEEYAGISTEIEMNRKAQYLMQNWKPIDVNEMIETTRQNNEFEPITDEMLETLQREGLIVKQGDGYKIKSETAQWRILAEYLQLTREREGAMYSIVSGLSKWDRVPTEETSERAWQRVGDLTTMLTLGFRAAAQNIFEIPLLISLTGSKAFMRATQQWSQDPDVRELGPRIGAVMRQTLDYLAHGQLQERWLNVSQFTRSDQFSRSFGAFAGWEAVKDAIREYLVNPGRTERVRLEQLQVNPASIEQFRRDGEGFDIEDIFAEAWDRVRENVIMASGVRPIDAPQVSNPFVDTIGDEMAKSAAWISNVVFKEYDAASLPKFLRQQNAMIRVFLKYKAWQGQQHAFVMRTIRHAIAEAKEGNWKPAGQFAQSAAALGLGGTVFTTFFALLSGRVEPGEMWSWARAMDGIASSASLGVFSMLGEAMMLAEGSPWRGAQLLESTLSSPTIGIASKIGGNIVALDVPGTAGAIVTLTPAVREVIKYGTGPLNWIKGDTDSEVAGRALSRLARSGEGRSLGR